MILGVDPGSRITGWALLQWSGSEAKRLDSGCIRTVDGGLPDRLRTIYQELTTIIGAWSPQSAAIEEAFVSKYPSAALVLGQARGVAVLAAMLGGAQVYEYAPRMVKQSVVGYGNADKEQVQFMVRKILHLPEMPQQDEADALAIALCHAHRETGLIRRASRISESKT